MMITFPFPYPGKGVSIENVRLELGSMGFVRCFHNGRIMSIDEWEPRGPEEIHVVADRLFLRDQDQSRIVDSVEQGFRFGKGRILRLTI